MFYDFYFVRCFHITFCRQSLSQFVASMMQSDGSFTMQEGGEIDLRASYCALAVSSILRLDCLPLISGPNSIKWIKRWANDFLLYIGSVFLVCFFFIILVMLCLLHFSCQTYEGGFGAVPGCEAHGGYAFCAVAALKILNSISLIDKPRLLSWLVNKQMSFEGGFQV